MSSCGPIHSDVEVTVIKERGKQEKSPGQLSGDVINVASRGYLTEDLQLSLTEEDGCLFTACWVDSRLLCCLQTPAQCGANVVRRWPRIEAACGSGWDRSRHTGVVLYRCDSWSVIEHGYRDNLCDILRGMTGERLDPGLSVSRLRGLTQDPIWIYSDRISILTVNV